MKQHYSHILIQFPVCPVPISVHYSGIALMKYGFSQRDIYTSQKFKGNLVAVVSTADNLSTEERQAFAILAKSLSF